MLKDACNLDFDTFDASAILSDALFGDELMDDMLNFSYVPGYESGHESESLQTFATPVVKHSITDIDSETRALSQYSNKRYATIASPLVNDLQSSPSPPDWVLILNSKSPQTAEQVETEIDGDQSTHIILTVSGGTAASL
jgi:hypothetical protein